MNGNQSGSGNLLDTTDCLEAVGVFKGWKNFFFVILVLCIIILQASFWLVDLGMIPITPGKPAGQQPGSAITTEPNVSSGNITGDKEAEVPKTNESATPPVTNEPNKPAEPNQDSNSTSGPVILASQTNVPASDEPAKESSSEKEFLFGINFDHISWIIRFVNAVFILVSVLYCLTILFSLKVSMLGNLEV